MRKVVRGNLVAWMIMGIVVIVPCAYGLHLVGNYLKIQRELAANERRIILPHAADSDTVEDGYIYTMRRDLFIREGRLNLVWFIVVPSANKRYSCSYDAGFSEFKQGDVVHLIHDKDHPDEGNYGYIVGGDDRTKGKVTQAWVNDEDEMEMLDTP
jgi:hypothetical protein